MEKSKRGNRYLPEVRHRAVRVEFEHPGEFIAVLPRNAPKIGSGLIYDSLHESWPCETRVRARTPRSAEYPPHRWEAWCASSLRSSRPRQQSRPGAALYRASLLLRR